MSTPIQAAGEAAYGSPSSVLRVLRHFRQREVPEVLTNTTLTQLGIKDSLIRMTWRSLVFLGLITEEGVTTDKFRSLRFATEDQYGQVLAEIITDAYSDVISVAPPESSSRSQLFNAFRPYTPASQHDRMITLFLALCEEAGIEVAQPAKRSAPRKSSDGKTTRGRTTQPKPPPDRPGGTGATPLVKPIYGHADPLVAALVAKLPPPGTVWPQADRDEFIAAFNAIAPMVWKETA
jgi:hypothetical protein